MEGDYRVSLFRNRNFSILFFGQLVSVFGNNLFLIALPWYVFAQTGSKTALALTGMAQTLPVLAGLFVGVWVDRWSKLRTMISSDLLRALLSLLLYAMVRIHASLWVLLVLVLLLQFIGTFFSPAQSSLIPLLVDSEDIPAASGMNQSGTAAAQMIGLLAGGALISMLNAPLLFLLNGITFLVSVLSLFFIRVQEPKANTEMSSLVDEWVDGMKLIVRSTMILRITIAALVANFAFAPYDVLITAWVKEAMHGQAYAFGIIEGAISVGVIVGGLFLGAVSKRISLKMVFILGMAGMGIGTVLLGVVPNLYWDTSVILIAGIAMGLVNGSFSAVAMQSVPKSMLGRVFGTLTALSALASPVGMALFGWLMLHLPISILFVLMGIPSILSGLSFVGRSTKAAATAAAEPDEATVIEGV